MSASRSESPRRPARRSSEDRCGEPAHPILLDVSRLVWRRWKRITPTGIDRVCLAYLAEFASDARATVQWKGRRVILPDLVGRRLFTFLLHPELRGFRQRLLRLLVRAVPTLRRSSRTPVARYYLNVGHTALDAPGLGTWLARHRLRAVYLIHDLIPITHPDRCRAGEASKHVSRIRAALETAHFLIVNSAATRSDVVAFAADQRLPLPEIVVAHLGVEALPEPSTTAQMRRPYFLCVGTIEARKNHVLLLHLWDRLRAELGPDTPDLVLVGRRGWEADEAFALLDRPPSPFGRIIELNECSDAELAALLDGAIALLMPSVAEGFGLPVLEAMARGTPVLASDLSVFRELTDGLATLIPPDDHAGWHSGVRALLANGGARQEQVRRLTSFRAPTWAAHMKAIHAALDSDGAASKATIS